MISTITSTHLLLTSKLLCSSISSYLLYKAYTCYVAADNNKMRYLWFTLGATLSCVTFIHAAWTLRLIDKVLYPVFITGLTKVTALAIRLGWVVNIAENFCFNLFIDMLSSKRFRFTIRHRIAGAIVLIAAIFMGLYVTLFFNIAQVTLSPFELLLFRGHLWYIITFNFISLITIVHRIRVNTLPRIVVQQIKPIIAYFVIPSFLIFLILSLPMIFTETIKMSSNGHLLLIFGDFYIFGALFFCIRRILCLRFLNINRQVQAAITNYGFIEHFKEITRSMNSASSLRDLEQSTARFFSQAFKLHYEAATLYIRPRAETPASGRGYNILPSMETWLSDPANHPLREYIAASGGVIIRDELDFEYFYDETSQQKQLLNLLNAVHADVVVFVYEHHALIAYITVKAQARPEKLFSNVEHDEMCIFASNLGPLIYFVQHRSFFELLRHEHAWETAIYNKQQEMNHYKECLKNLLANTGHRTTGVILCQRRKLVWANDRARALLQVGRGSAVDTCPHAIDLHNIAQEAIRTKRERQIIIQDREQRTVHCVAFPCENEAHSVILAYHPDVADTFSIPFDRLKDISSWEYALLLETTTSGKIINELIPSSAPAFLNFKIDLLKLALNKKATLLELPEADQLAVAHIIHHISLRTKFHTLKLTEPERGQEVALQLFGAESLGNAISTQALLTSLHDRGTLCIQNIEYLGLETQKRLAACIETGMFRPLTRDSWQPGNVRIICTTSSSLERLTANKKIAPELCDALRPTALALPSLAQIPHQDLIDLVHGMSEQAVQSKELLALIGLNNQEAITIAEQASLSVQELKHEVHHVLEAKSNRTGVNGMVKLNTQTPPEMPPHIAQALQLGKKALKDKHIMTLLWETFKSQAKIGALLKVNRSSVNRRLKEFNLATDEQELES